MRGTAAALAATVFVAAASATIPSVWPAELGQYNKALHDASDILAIQTRHCTFFRTGVQFAEVGTTHFNNGTSPFIPHFVDITFANINVYMYCTCVNKGSNALRSAAIGAASIQVANRNTPPRRHLANIPAAVERDATDYATDARHHEQLDYSYKLVTDAEIPRGMGGPGLQQLVQLGRSLAPAPMIIAVTTYSYLLTAINFAATIKRHVNRLTSLVQTKPALATMPLLRIILMHLTCFRI